MKNLREKLSQTGNKSDIIHNLLEKIVIKNSKVNKHYKKNQTYIIANQLIEYIQNNKIDKTKLNNYMRIKKYRRLLNI